jgi:hypothetical protein
MGLAEDGTVPANSHLTDSCDTNGQVAVECGPRHKSSQTRQGDNFAAHQANWVLSHLIRHNQSVFPRRKELVPTERRGRLQVRKTNVGTALTVRLKSSVSSDPSTPSGRCTGLSILPRSGIKNRAGLKTWTRIWSSCAPKRLQFLLSAHLYSVENTYTPGLNPRLLTEGL